MDEQNDIEVIPNGHISHSAPIDVPKSKERRVDNSDSENNDAKSRIAFLDIRQDNNRFLGSSPDKSPTVNAKPFVPPLDFSTLHENVGGQGKPKISSLIFIVGNV